MKHIKIVDETRRVAIPKGTKIVCPLCLKVISEVKKDLRYGDALDDDAIEGFKTGDRLLCPYCGFPFSMYIETLVYKGGIIYTDKGWLPDFLHDLKRTQEVIYSCLKLNLVELLKIEGLWRDEWLKIGKNKQILDILKNK